MKDEKKHTVALRLFSVRIPEWQIKEIEKFVEHRKTNDLTIDTIQEVFEFALTEFIQKHGV